MHKNHKNKGKKRQNFLLCGNIHEILCQKSSILDIYKRRSMRYNIKAPRQSLEGVHGGSPVARSVKLMTPTRATTRSFRRAFFFFAIFASFLLTNAPLCCKMKGAKSPRIVKTKCSKGVVYIFLSSSANHGIVKMQVPPVGSRGLFWAYFRLDSGGLATIGACVFGASASVGALFCFERRNA